ncbi:hypothetical protein GB928_023225 [Shinella curvata]|uniref:Uncharacterized protein n=1 Tax=Shinella curvata TaxID=1817964 RepID=A0ABT8XK66_9HYPH|nr:hypothetical protein [Shinella curvata]MCJ8056406.1 hypothetical protein [Shinella curvata]MDO6124117.1 hypothetical protein [Shinella curvata]
MAQALLKRNREIPDFEEKITMAFKVPDSQAVALVVVTSYQRGTQITPGSMT